PPCGAACSERTAADGACAAGPAGATITPAQCGHFTRLPPCWSATDERFPQEGQVSVMAMTFLRRSSRTRPHAALRGGKLSDPPGSAQQKICASCGKRIRSREEMPNRGRHRWTRMNTDGGDCSSKGAPLLPWHGRLACPVAWAARPWVTVLGDVRPDFGELSRAVARAEESPSAATSSVPLV
ncbi:MAG: hypothetical protein JWP03_4, partial [Phycisphaerales bacterium]|nr:hypothetical protein [Phycisphaerales bacterium]